MSLDGLARFALSRSGRVYAASCERFGVDPASILEEEDDVIALNFRAALMYALATPEQTYDDVPTEGMPEGGIVTDLEALEKRLRLA